MDRRAFIAGGVIVVARPRLVQGQPTVRPVRIGWISITPQDPNRGPEQFRPLVERHLRQLGWDPRFEVRYAAGDQPRLAVLAEDLARTRPDVIVAPDTIAALAAKKATAIIPVVMSSSDPVGAGLVASLARPGGNVTGVSAQFDGVASKWVQFLQELGVAGTIALVCNPDSSSGVERLAAIERMAVSVGLRVQRLEIRNAGDVEAVVQAMGRTTFGGLIYDADLLLLPYAARVMDAARRRRLPTVLGWGPQVAIAGGLLSYGPSLPDLYRLIAVYVDRILRGAKPGDVPVEQVRKHDLVVSLKTADAIGLVVPASIRLRADEVIQ